MIKGVNGLRTISCHLKNFQMAQIMIVVLLLILLQGELDS